MDMPGVHLDPSPGQAPPPAKVRAVIPCALLRPISSTTLRRLLGTPPAREARICLPSAKLGNPPLPGYETRKLNFVKHL